MADLNTFRVAAYSQGRELRAQYKFNDELHGGVCYSLMCEWFRLLMAGGMTANERMAKLEEDLKLAGSRQRIYTQVFADVLKDGGPGKTWHDVAAAMTKHGKLFGLEFAYFVATQGGANVIKDHVSATANKDGYYYLSIKFQLGGGHAIGIYSGRPLLIYDPNFGEFEAPSGKRGSFFNALWNRYAGVNGGIKKAILFSTTKQRACSSSGRRRPAPADARAPGDPGAA
jgi:hypothetical protein